MKRGDVIFWPKFPFEDKTSGHGIAPSNKLLVVMGCDDQDGLLMFRTTTKTRDDRPDPDGCHADNSVYRFNVKRNKFTDPCWVQYEMPIVREKREVSNAGARVIFALTSEETQAVINCYKRSPELTNWTWAYCSSLRA